MNVYFCNNTVWSNYFVYVTGKVDIPSMRHYLGNDNYTEQIPAMTLNSNFYRHWLKGDKMLRMAGPAIQSGNVISQGEINKPAGDIWNVDLEMSVEDSGGR